MPSATDARALPAFLRLLLLLRTLPFRPILRPVLCPFVGIQRALGPPEQDPTYLAIVADLVLESLGDVRDSVPENLEIGLGVGHALRDRQNIGGDMRGWLRTESIVSSRPAGVGVSELAEIVCRGSDDPVH